MSTRPPTRRTVLTGLALATTGAALSRKLPALDLSATAQPPIDPMRPQYHLQPTHGWMNDPCGPIYWARPLPHVLPIQPDAAVWGDMHWAHAISPDMVRWRREPIALAPTPGGPDPMAASPAPPSLPMANPPCCTPVSQLPPDQATLPDGNQQPPRDACLAVAEDDALLHWRKLPQPVIPAPPAGMKVIGFRDPSPWREEKDGPWYMVVASGQRASAATSSSIAPPTFANGTTCTRSAKASRTASRAPIPSIAAKCGSAPTSSPSEGKHVLIHSTERRTSGRSARSTQRPCSSTRRAKACSITAPTTRPNPSSMRRATASSGAGSPRRARKPSTPPPAGPA